MNRQTTIIRQVLLDAVVSATAPASAFPFSITLQAHEVLQVSRQQLIARLTQPLYCQTCIWGVNVCRGGMDKSNAHNNLMLILVFPEPVCCLFLDHSVVVSCMHSDCTAVLISGACC